MDLREQLIIERGLEMVRQRIEAGIVQNRWQVVLLRTYQRSAGGGSRAEEILVQSVVLLRWQWQVGYSM
jgi:hypothetical protein